MLSSNDRISQNIDRREQRIRQMKAKEARDKRKQEAIKRDRQRIIGEIISDIFPEVMRFQPYRTHVGNQKEFAPLIRFLTEFAADKEYISNLKERVKRGMST